MTDGIFQGLKVIDCASWIAGPAAATILSDFGAEVIKIEPPGAGDHPTATALYAAIVTALCRRERTGRGGVAQTSLLQNGLWANGCYVQNRLFGEVVGHRPPRTDTPSALANHYCCRDGRWFLMALHNEPRQLASFLKAIDAEHLAEDPRFHTQPARRANHKALSAILDGIFARRDL